MYVIIVLTNFLFFLHTVPVAVARHEGRNIGLRLYLVQNFKVIEVYNTECRSSRTTVNSWQPETCVLILKSEVTALTKSHIYFQPSTNVPSPPQK